MKFFFDDANAPRPQKAAATLHFASALVFLMTFTFPQLSTAAPTAREEIITLMSRLQTSGCQFYRNGTWYSDATKAKEHLQRKLDYFEKQNTLPATTEQLIRLGGSKSTMTGEPYKVKCAITLSSPASNGCCRSCEKCGLRKRAELKICLHMGVGITQALNSRAYPF
jgi:hypothetical protein